MTFSDRPAQGRRSFLLIAASAALLAGCATRPLDRPGPNGPRVNRVAVLVPLSGPDAAVGRALGNAARLAMADTGTKAFELTLFDTAGRGATVAAQNALATNHDLILGPLLSEDVRAVTPLAQRARVPVIAFSNDRDATARGTYILGFTPSQAVERVVQEAARRGSRRFAAIAPAGDYGQRSVQSLAAAVQQAGGQLVGVENYAMPGQARAAVQRLSSRPYDALLIADGPRAAVLAAPAIPANVRVLGTELWASGGAGASQRLRGAWYAAPTQGQWGQFLQRYKARYPGQTPPRIASLGYDAVLLTARGARSWAPGRRFPLGAIDDREGFAGVDGIFRFRADNVAQRAFEVRAVTASGSTLVSPAPTSF
ncbi:penicillin-binding protein activator [Sphingomonas kaistensis]|uniref:Penicillin-binding protein activator n=1 Tax=Sphingomonas kaistensis TaxID=298708 RepID=A0ABZ2G5Q9_9SPHN